MLTPYQREVIYGLNSIWATANHTTGAESAPSNGITTEDHGPTSSINFEDIIQNSASALSAAAYMDWCLVPPINLNMSTSEPMSPYQSELRRQMEILFPANRAVGAAPVPSNYVTPLMEDHNTSTEATEFAEAHLHVATTQIAHSCLATMPCQWTGEDNSETCGAQIACKRVPAHFGDTHGIRKLGRDTMVDCMWEGCLKRIKRKNFVRHVRERHLDHSREKNPT